MVEAVLDITDLRTYFHTDEGVVRAVDGVTLRVDKGHTLGIVGESGSGKSVTSLSVMQLLASSARIESGKIALLGKDLVGLPEPQMRDIRGKDVSMIFQEPMTSLNPVFTVGSQVMEAIILHQQVAKEEARRRTVELFGEVGIPNPEQRVDSYPHQMSGGQKQRVMIAMALSCNPKLLIADEPTTALDVTIQAQILDMLRELRDLRGMAILFITHDLGVIAEIADEVMVMYRGEMVEYGSVLEIFANPQHPYTKGLLACRPRLDSQYRRLPTVDDFMEAKIVDGQVNIIEKKMDEARFEPPRPRRARETAAPEIGIGDDGPSVGANSARRRYRCRGGRRRSATGSGKSASTFSGAARRLVPRRGSRAGGRRSELPYLSGPNAWAGRRIGLRQNNCWAGHTPFD